MTYILFVTMVALIITPLAYCIVFNNSLYKQRLRNIWELVKDINMQDQQNPSGFLAIKHDRILTQIYDERQIAKNKKEDDEAKRIRNLLSTY